MLAPFLEPLISRCCHCLHSLHSLDGHHLVTEGEGEGDEEGGGERARLALRVFEQKLRFDGG